MLRRVEDYSEEETLSMILSGSDFAYFVASKDKGMYAKYKNNEHQELTISDSKSMNILSILDRLGYPMDELGTYLYKEMISEISDSLVGIEGKRSDMDKCRDILASLSDGYSSFYHSVAREYLEMGIRSFHLYIERAIAKINYDAIDLALSAQIFGSNPPEQTYGLQAFQLAAYTLGYGIKEEIHPQVVKKLSNTPDDLMLKKCI